MPLGAARKRYGEFVTPEVSSPYVPRCVPIEDSGKAQLKFKADVAESAAASYRLEQSAERQRLSGGGSTPIAGA
jgi:hypothetical protein